MNAHNHDKHKLPLNEGQKFNNKMTNFKVKGKTFERYHECTHICDNWNNKYLYKNMINIQSSERSGSKVKTTFFERYMYQEFFFFTSTVIVISAYLFVKFEVYITLV